MAEFCSMAGVCILAEVYSMAEVCSLRASCLAYRQQYGRGVQLIGLQAAVWPGSAAWPRSVLWPGLHQFSFAVCSCKAAVIKRSDRRTSDRMSSAS